MYDHILAKNSNNFHKSAMIMRFDNGTEQSYTYGQMFAGVNDFADSLGRAEIVPGDRVAIVAESCPEWCIAYLAVSKLKATAVLIDASIEQTELQKLLEKSEVRCILTTPKTMEKLSGFEDVPILNILNNANNFDDSPCKICAKNTAGGNEAASIIIFSSGTTKTASGILHSDDSLLKTTLMTIQCNGLNSDDRFLAILPNSHIYGLICQVIGCLVLGGANVCFLESLTPDALVRAFGDYKPTIFPAVPKVYELLKTQIIRKIDSDAKTKKLFANFFPKCLALRKKTGINLGKVLFKSIHKGFGGEIKVLCSAGAPMDAQTAEFYYGTGFNLLITYGATETNIPSIGNYGKDLTTDTCGKAYPGISVKISDSGELLVKSPYFMLGYYGDEAATRDAYDEDGWFKTGDLGSIDEKENIRILGRCKDNIVLATGKKIAPDDIEIAYMGVTGVKELVVCGIPVSDNGYDVVHAFVVTEALKADFVLENLRQRSASLPQNMRLSGIHLVDEIPKTSLQKPKRYLLKKMVEQNKLLNSLSDTKNESGESDDIEAVVMTAIARAAGISITEISLDTKIFSELAIDSLGSIELTCEIEEICNVSIFDFLHKEMTVLELITYVTSPNESKKSSLSGHYPMKKNTHDYNVFHFVQNIFRSIYHVIIENDKVLPDNSGYIICANHVSNFDYLFITLNFKRERFSKFCCMAKKELFSKKLLNKRLVQIGGMVPVDRGGFVQDAFSAVCDKLNEKWGVLIHPEGTRSETGEIGEFKRGAALLAIEADVPVVPAYINGGYEVYPKSRKIPNLLDWKRMKRYQVKVRYGEPIFPRGLNADELMKRIELAVIELKNDVTINSISV